MEDERIKDDQLRSTSIFNGLSQAANGRLNHKDGLGGWCPNRPLDGNRAGPYAFDDRFIHSGQAEHAVRLKGIATQGRYNGEEKVERYWIAYTPDIKNVRHKLIYDEPDINVKVSNISKFRLPVIEINKSNPYPCRNAAKKAKQVQLNKFFSY